MKYGQITVRCEVHQRGVLAIGLKSIFEALAKELQIRKPDSVRLISDEQTPIRTDDAVSDAANLGKDTIRKARSA